MAYFQQTELNVAKTEFLVIGSNQRLHSFSDDQINIEVNAKLITKVKDAKSLGVIIDEHLSWSNHIGELSKKISSAIGALKRVGPYISERSPPPNLSSVDLINYPTLTIVVPFGATETYPYK